MHKLSCNKHANNLLQNVYNKYGAKDFCFEILEEMPNSSNKEIREKEQE